MLRVEVGAVFSSRCAFVAQKGLARDNRVVWHWRKALGWVCVQYMMRLI
jgi:hypothetical protein